MKIPAEALAQLRALITSYNALPAAADDRDSRTDILVASIEKRLEHPESAASMWWTDLAQVENAIVSRLDEDALRARLFGWRRRMHEVIGDSRYATYAANASVSAAGDINKLRADLQECIRAVYYFYATYGLAARGRDKVIRSLMRYAAVIAGVELVACLVVNFVARMVTTPAGFHRCPIDIPCAAYTWFNLAIAMSIAAVVGSVVSVQRRLEDPKVDVDPFYRDIQMSSDQFSAAFSSPFFGAAFGLVAFMLLATGLLEGAILPDFKNFWGEGVKVKNVSFLLLYGFLAGFAEQLVPDVLTRIASQALNGVKKTPEPALAASTGGQDASKPTDTPTASTDPKQSVPGSAPDPVAPVKSEVETKDTSADQGQNK